MLGWLWKKGGKLLAVEDLQGATWIEKNKNSFTVNIKKHFYSVDKKYDANLDHFIKKKFIYKMF